MTSRYDAVIVGAGPNGLSAAVELARNGLATCVLEGAAMIGGGTRTAELTLPGFRHDVCAAVHPLAVSSPFFRSLPLGDHGLEWLHHETPAAHVLDGGDVAVLHSSIAATAAALGTDAAPYHALVGPLVDRFEAIADAALGPIPRLVKTPATALRLALRSLPSARVLARRFAAERSRALFAGMAAHAATPLRFALTGGVALLLMAAAHSRGWPIARGGSAAITTALARYLETLGGELRLDSMVRTMADVPPAAAVIFDLDASQVASIAGARLPSRYRSRLEGWRRGPGIFKVDWALDGPIPWTSPEARRASTVHVGGTFDEIDAGETAVWSGHHHDRPFVIAAQPTVADPSRAPAGQHIAWGYAHVPTGSRVDMTELIESRLERFAPGFRDRVLARHTMTTADLAAYNPAYVGGDITGGAFVPGQVLARPAFRRDPYRTPADGIYICSASTPPGPGVHGMGGYYAARSVLRSIGPG